MKASRRLWVVAYLSLALCFDPAFAEPGEKSSLPIAAAQSFLFEQAIYTGKVTGVLTTETTVAVRHFQMIRCLEVNGKLDKATLFAMGFASNLKADTALAKGDGEFLEELSKSAATKGNEPLQSSRDNNTTAAANSVAMRAPLGSAQGDGVSLTGTAGGAEPTAAASPEPPSLAVTSGEVKAFLEAYCVAAEKRVDGEEKKFFMLPGAIQGGKGSFPAVLNRRLGGERRKWAMQRFHLRSFVLKEPFLPGLAEVKFTVRYLDMGEGRRRTGLYQRGAALTRDKTGALKFQSIWEESTPLAKGDP